MQVSDNAPQFRRWWADQPDATVVGQSTGVAATLWSWPGGAHETSGAASADRHTISVCLDPLATEFALDGRQVFADKFRPGMLAFIPAGRRPWAVQHGKARKLHISVPHALIAEATTDGRRAFNSGDVAPYGGGVIQDPAAALICGRVLANMDDQRAGSAMLLDALGIELAVHMARHWTGLRDLDVSLTTPISAFVLNRVLEAMRSDLASDVSLSNLARHVGLSPFHFARGFKSSTGMPPHRYIVKLRLERARHLLETTDLSITEISAQVGYENPSYLARLFRKELGVTPARYRREARS